MLVLAGQADAYRNLCERMLAQFATSEDPAETDAACKAALLAPGTIEIPSRPLKILEPALANGTATALIPDELQALVCGTAER